MTTEEYNILMAKREGMRTGIFNTTSLPMHEIDALVNQTFPIPMKQVPREILLSNGIGYRVDGLGVMISAYLDGDWTLSNLSVEDLTRLGDLAKNPTKWVEDV